MAYVQANDKSQPPPVFRVDDWCFCYIIRCTLYFFMVTRDNSNIAMLLVFLNALSELLAEYLGELTADAIIDSFTLIYELLDEVMDYGYPQTLDSQTLLAYVLREKPRDLKAQPKEIPIQATGLVTWRPEGLQYNPNEIYCDVVEKVSLLMSKSGSIMQNEIVGEINLTCQLSGMPEVRIGLNDKLVFLQSSDETQRIDVSRRLFELDDIKFHQCVRLAQYEKDHSITFIPPDGSFNLLRYRLSSALRPLIAVEMLSERHRGSRIELLVFVKSECRPGTFAEEVKVIVPIPPDIDSPRAACAAGSILYSPKDNTIVWTIRQFPGGKIFALRAHFGIPSLESEEIEERRPIRVSFEIPTFTVSGLRVQYLKVLEKSSYEATSWVKYRTVNGDYEFRT
jgi:AP-1 complex subunit mu